MAINPYQPSNSLAAGDQQNQKKQGTGFTNLNRIMDANQGNRLGQAVGGGVQQQAGQAKESLNQARAGFDQEAQANRLDTDANKAKVQSGLQAADQGSDIDDQTAQDFSRFREGRYTGPDKLQNEDQVINQAQNAQNLGSLSSSAGGRQALLQRFVGGNGYTQGKQQLDNLLLGQSGSQDLRDARRSTQNLNQQALTTADAARQQGTYLANQAQAFGQDVTGQLTGKESDYNNAVDQVVDKTATTEAQKAAQYEQIRAYLAANGQRVGPQNLTSANDSYLGNVNKALGLAAQNGVLQGKDQDIIAQMNDALLTPAQKILRQTTQGDNTAYLGYGAAQPGQTLDTAGGNIYSNLGLDEVLNGAFKQAAAENVNRTGVASDADRAKMAALAKLSGKKSEYSDSDARYKAGSAAFDLNQAGSQVDQELARLKGESIETLPTNYEQTSLAQKLKNTIAPTTADFGNQFKGDVGGIFASDATVGDRAASLGKALLDPYRGIAGAAMESGGQLYDDTGRGLNAMFGKNNTVEDRVGGAATLANSGANQLALTSQQASNLLSAIPGVGGTLAAPAAAASNLIGSTLSAPTSFKSLVNKPAEIAKAAAATAAAAAKSALNVFNPFSWCYGAGTPIKMKNGSYKAVDKLKLGDELFYGGKVTAAGSAKEKDIYEYKGTKVTGGHAVFENGKFIHVSDSVHAKKIPGEMVVYPVECEKHIMVTKTHLGADFSELDNARDLTPEQRLTKLNSDKARLKRLDTASALLFSKKNED